MRKDIGFHDIDRRSFLVLGGGAVAASLAARKTQAAPMINRGAMQFTLMKLPYADNALAPVISSNTVGFHYGKHHKGYVDKLNELTKDTPYASMELQTIIKQTAGDKTKTPIYNNAAELWNHDFYWNSLKPSGGGKPAGRLAAKINEGFGSYENFKKELSAAAVAQFGTGWAWLVADNTAKLKVVKTGDADAPFIDGLKPLLTIDVWEHAYYLDYQNRRADYVNAVIDQLLNWDFAAANLAR